MRIFLACPAPPRSLRGNRVTAARWARLLRSLGHRVTVGQDWNGDRCDLLIALHARKSYRAVRDFAAHQPKDPLVVCLTGTDLYHDLPHDFAANESLEMADRIVALQPKAVEALPVALRNKVRIIWQSVRPLDVGTGKKRGPFTVCVLGHLRREKDPLRAGLALSHLPREIPIRVIQAGQALSPSYARQARTLMKREPRYRWLGELDRTRARRLLARSQTMVISSRLEGGANVVSEAIVQGVPVLASAVPGNVGMLGEDYAGYYAVGDTQALAQLLRRAWQDGAFYRGLQRWCARLAGRFRPERERNALRLLLAELTEAKTAGTRVSGALR